MLALPLLILQGHYSPPRELSLIPPPILQRRPFLDLACAQHHFVSANCSLPFTGSYYTSTPPSFVTMPFSLVSLPHVVRLLFVTACCTVCYLLPHAMRFALCCHMPCSLLLVAFVPTCRIVCYLLLHAMWFAICCHVPCSSLFVASCCCMPCSLLFIAICPVCYLLPHAMQFAICC